MGKGIIISKSWILRSFPHHPLNITSSGVVMMMYLKKRAEAVLLGSVQIHFYGEQEMWLHDAWSIRCSKLTDHSLYLFLHKHDSTSTLCKWVGPAQCTRLSIKSDQTVRPGSADRIWIKILLLQCLLFLCRQ